MLSNSDKMKQTFRNFGNLKKSINKNYEQDLLSKPNHLNLASNFETFKKIQKHVCKYLNEKKSKIFSEIVGANRTNPYPFIVTKKQIDDYQRIQEALYYSIKTIVTNYQRDYRIQEVYKFSSEIKEILDLCNEKPYKHIGAYR